jgi:ubiquinone/menaquinone biosynthesis C-methylase UbiE
MYDAILRAFNRLPIRPNEFMTWINGDDILLQGTLDIISQIQYSLPTISWVGSHTHNIFEDGRINVTRPNPTPTAVIAAGLCDGHKHHWTHLQQEGTFFRKSLWDKCSHVLKDFKLAGDWALWRKFAETEEYYQCSKPLGAFRIRAGQLSSTNRTEYETEVDNVIPMETRDLEFETFYSLRRQLHANVIEIDNRNKVVAISKITDKVRDTFYQRHRRSQRSMGAAFKEETVLKDSIVNKASILEHPDHFTYARKSHWEYFHGLDVELFGEPLDPTQVDLKRYQDLLAFLFIKQNIRKGSRLLEIGGGNSRILKKLSADYECWNVDKLEGVGNGPVSADIHGVTLVRDYIGNFNSQLPNDYFDFVFSVSVLEHVPKGNPGLFDNIVKDINRVAKDGAFSLQLFDIVFKGQSTRVFHDLIRYIFANVQTLNKLVEPEEANASQDLYFLSEDVYENVWFKYTKQSYKQFGRPTSINILWKKSG